MPLISLVSTRAASVGPVHAHQAIERDVSTDGSCGQISKPNFTAQRNTRTKEAREEIHGYIAIRDLLLSEAETITTLERLQRATIANEFVETCLRTARSPYERQCLDEIEAAHARERCEAAKMRITQLTGSLLSPISN